MVGAEDASDRGEMAWVVWEVDVLDGGIDEGPSIYISWIEYKINIFFKGILYYMSKFYRVFP